MDSKKINLIVLVVGLLGLVAASAAAPAEPSSQCRLMRYSQASRMNQATKTVSEDGKALAYFDGFMFYSGLSNDMEQVYMPLNLSAVELVEGEQDATRRQLVLDLNCAQLEFELKYEPNSGRDAAEGSSLISTERINVKLSEPSRGLSSCTIADPEHQFTFSSANRVSFERLELVCSNSLPSEGNQLVDVVRFAVKKVEFELVDGQFAIEQHRMFQFVNRA